MYIGHTILSECKYTHTIIFIKYVFSIVSLFYQSVTPFLIDLYNYFLYIIKSQNAILYRVNMHYILYTLQYYTLHIFFCRALCFTHYTITICNVECVICRKNCPRKNIFIIRFGGILKLLSAIFLVPASFYPFPFLSLPFSHYKDIKLNLDIEQIISKMI